MMVQEIVLAYLRAAKLDGLCNSTGCACELDDLMPCGLPGPSCEAGKLRPCPVDCGEHDWHIVPAKAPAGETPP